VNGLNADIESIVKNIDEINSRYAAKRDKLGIDKKAILLDTPFAREYMKDYHKLSTDIRLIGLEEVPPFQSAMEIYDGKVAYITFAPEKMMGVIIHDLYLYEMHKYLFEFIWSKAGAFGVATAQKTKTAPREDAVGEDEYFTRF
jgi:fido (protein-threonine AMPylation protein)